MISTFLAEHARWVPLAFWLVVAMLLAVAVGLVVARLRRLQVVGLVASLVAVALLTLSPGGPPTSFIPCSTSLSMPFQGIETLANVALLLPRPCSPRS